LAERSREGAPPTKDVDYWGCWPQKSTPYAWRCRSRRRDLASPRWCS